MRTIIHLDLDAFFCAVEEQRDPSLRDKPFAVGGRPEGRGVVASCSYAARQFGVRSAMPMSRAVQLCPKLLVVAPNFPAYRAASQAVMTRLYALTPLVEQLSIDEAFLDVSELTEPGIALAQRLQQTIRDQLQLSCSLGVASNKLVAKIATDVGKAAVRSGHSPNALLVVPPGEEAVFLAPLPASALWGVGPRTAERLAELGIHSIGDIAAWPEGDLIRRFGKHGADLARRSCGLDSRPIVTEREAKSVSKETTYSQDVANADTLRQTIHTLSEGVEQRLRRDGLLGITVKLKLRWHDFTTLTRQTTLRQPTDDADAIASAALHLFDQLWQRGRPVRLLGVGVSGLSEPSQQLSLWDAPPVEDEKTLRLRETIVALQQRFGAQMVRWGAAGDLRNCLKRGGLEGPPSKELSSSPFAHRRIKGEDEPEDSSDSF